LLPTEATRKNQICSKATDDEISTVAKSWFRFASDSNGGRKERAKKAAAAEAATRPTRPSISSDNEDYL
jgi:hypothetical protein